MASCVKRSIPTSLASACVRPLSTSGRPTPRSAPKKSSSTPFESHLASATARHREARKQTQQLYVGAPRTHTHREPLLNEARVRVTSSLSVNGNDLSATPSPATLGPRRLLEVKGQSEIAAQSATASHRRVGLENRRDAIGTKASGATDSGGSFAASMSATAQHRRQNLSRTSAGSGSVVANPSTICIPIAPATYPEPSGKTEVIADDVDSKEKEREESEMTGKEPVGLNPMVGVAVVSVAVGGAASFWWVG